MRDAARRGLAVGFFDGVHLGHRAVLSRAAAALTFRNHPLGVLVPSRAPRLLMPCDARLSAIRACGVREVTALDFTRELACTPAEDFLSILCASPHAAEGIYCGENWRFGRGGEGDASFLRSHGITVHVVTYAEHKGVLISSTRIREALESGAVTDAADMLGRAWSVCGNVAKGKGLGSEIGFPTINLHLDALQLRLPHGVYAVEALGYRAIANFGLAPTTGIEAWTSPVLEIHFPEGLPGGFLPTSFDVSFHRFLRPERRFKSIEELKKQIAEDIRSL